MGLAHWEKLNLKGLAVRAFFSSLIPNYLNYWKKGLDFSGIANRKQYWQPAIINGIITILFIVFKAPLIVPTAWGLISVLPSLSINMRRLRDAGKNTLWAYLTWVNPALKILPRELYIVLGMVWFIGMIYVLSLLIKPSTNQT